MRKNYFESSPLRSSLVAFCAVFSVCFVGAAAFADGPRWTERGVSYLNFEGKKDIGGVGAPIIVIGPRYDGTGRNGEDPPPTAPPPESPTDPNGLPFWLENSPPGPDYNPPPYDPEPEPDYPEPDTYPYPQPSPPREPQKAFNARIFLGGGAAGNFTRRALLINTIRGQVQNNYSFAHIDFELAFTPIPNAVNPNMGTLRPNAAAFARGDFEWVQDPNNAGKWYVRPVKFDGVPDPAGVLKSQRWIVDIGDTNPGLRGFAIIGAGVGPRGWTPRGKAYVFSDTLAHTPPVRPFDAAAAAPVKSSNGVSHTTAHEMGHLLGCWGTPPRLFLPFVLAIDADGHTVCPGGTCAQAQLNRMTHGLHVPTKVVAGVETHCQSGVLREANRNFRVQDKFDIGWNIGPNNALLRLFYQRYDMLRKAPPQPPGGNNDPIVTAMLDYVQNVLVRNICDQSQRHFTAQVRSDAVNTLSSFLGQNAPYDFPPTSSPWLPNSSTDTVELAALMLLAEDSWNRLNSIPLYDMDLNGFVNVNELLTIINSWGPCQPAPAECLGDLDCDGQVNVNDLLIIINHWGPV